MFWRARAGNVSPVEPRLLPKIIVVFLYDLEKRENDPVHLRLFIFESLSPNLISGKNLLNTETLN